MLIKTRDGRRYLFLHLIYPVNGLWRMKKGVSEKIFLGFGIDLSITVPPETPSPPNIFTLPTVQHWRNGETYHCDCPRSHPPKRQRFSLQDLLQLFSRHPVAFSPPFVSPPALSVVAEPPSPLSQTQASPQPARAASALDIHARSSLVLSARSTRPLDLPHRLRRAGPGEETSVGASSAAAVSGHLRRSRRRQRRLEGRDRGVCEACRRRGRRREEWCRKGRW